MFIKGVTHSYT